MTEMTVPFTPVPASRPRVARWGTFYAEPYRSYKKELTEWFKQNFKGPLLAGVLNVTIEIVVARPKTTKLPHPRADVDNYAKATLDGMNKVVFKDDSAVNPLLVSKRWTRKGELPHTKVVIQ
jgi:Holliday junction resolvase RusA-like endonuclease